ncbi:MAG: putative peptidoglycan glycosyltransferase FtsW [Lachnospiraceae bacterium]|nr:putative peptidoglycan glycosyltransferase FtsW [Lachnospiraceae bacterium]
MTRNDKHKPYVDYTLIYILLLLLGFGLIMVYSTSSYTASITQATGNDPYYFLRKQANATIIGLILMVIVSFIPHRVYTRFANLAMYVSIVLIFLILTPLGYEANGAKRWIRIGGISLQPAEVAKVAVILYMTVTIVKNKDMFDDIKSIIKNTILPIISCLLVFLLTRNLSSAIIIAAICIIMMYVVDKNNKRYLIGAVALGCIAVIAIIVALSIPDSPDVGFRMSRIKAWRNPEAYSDTIGYQTLQSLYAIGSGGFFGKGLGQSSQKLGFIPEAQNDMIFSIICEELGLFGGVCVIAMFIVLLYRMWIIANSAPDMYGMLLVTGVMAHIAVQVVLNIAVVTNVIPNTGISLPFISYGGSSVMFLLAEMGMVIGVARSIDFGDI